MFGRNYGWDTIDDENKSEVAQAPTGYQSTTFNETYGYTYTAQVTTGSGSKNNPVTTSYVSKAGTATAAFTDTYYIEKTLWQEADAGKDTLSFAAGVNVEDVALEMSGNDLLIGIRDPNDPDTDFRALSDRLRIQNWSDVNDRIETFKFADGTSIDVSQMVLAGSGDKADDTLTGDDATNWLSGGSGNDTIIGAGGNDILREEATSPALPFAGCRRRSEEFPGGA